MVGQQTIKEFATQNTMPFSDNSENSLLRLKQETIGEDVEEDDDDPYFYENEDDEDDAYKALERRQKE